MGHKWTTVYDDRWLVRTCRCGREEQDFALARMGWSATIDIGSPHYCPAEMADRELRKASGPTAGEVTGVSWLTAIILAASIAVSLAIWIK